MHPEKNNKIDFKNEIKIPSEIENTVNKFSHEITRIIDFKKL